MSSEVHKYIENRLEKNANMLSADLINFPNDTKVYDAKNLKIKTYNIWKISDEGNDDQLKAVIGVCFMLVSLTVMGLFSNFL
mgnify:FL=1